MEEKKYMIRTDNGYFNIHRPILRVLNNMLNSNTEERRCVHFLYNAIKRWHLEDVDDFCTASKDKASILTDEVTQFLNNNNEPIKLDNYTHYYIIEIDGNKEIEMKINN
jgi:hypothetical protein